MRRSNPGHGYQPLATNALEEENNQLADQLSDRIHMLKSVSIDINQEIKYSNKRLGEMDEDLERTSGSLTSSITRVLRLSKGGHNYYILYLILFSMVVFFFLWITTKFR